MNLTLDGVTLMVVKMKVRLVVLIGEKLGIGLYATNTVKMLGMGSHNQK